jgi:hypothetical protein
MLRLRSMIRFCGGIADCEQRRAEEGDVGRRHARQVAPRAASSGVALRCSMIPGRDRMEKV